MRVMITLKYYLLILLLLAIMSMVGCVQEPEDPISIASSPWPGYEPLYLSRDLEYLNPDKFQLLDLPSSDITMESFRNGSADIGTVTLDEALELIYDGVQLKIIATLDVSNGADAVLASPAIKSLSDIKGKRVSIINISLGFYMLNRMLEKAGLQRNDVEVFPMAEIKQERFYKKGKADLVITFEPMKTRIMKQGAHVIFDSSDIPDEIIDVMVIQQNVLDKRFGDICKLVGVWNRSLKYMNDNPEVAAVKISERLGITLPEYSSMMKGVHIVQLKENKEMLSGKEPRLISVANTLSKVMVENNILPATVDVTEYIDDRFTDCHI